MSTIQRQGKRTFRCTSCESRVSLLDCRGDQEDRDICGGCYSDITCECALCGESFFREHRGAIGSLLVVIDSEAGVPPGLYRVTSHPYYCQGLVGGGWLFSDSIELIGLVPKGVDTEGCPAGHLCPRCCKEQVEGLREKIEAAQRLTGLMPPEEERPL